MTTNSIKRRSIQSVYCYIAALFLILFSSSVQAQICYASSVVVATTLVDDASYGDLAFNNPDNAAPSDNNRASATTLLTLLTGDTHLLKATGFGFNLPNYVSICGIKVEVEKRAGGLGIGAWIQDGMVKLMKNGVMAGTNQADLGTDWSGSDAYATYGGTNSLWGTTFTAADVNNSNFGIAFSAKFKGLAIVLPSAQIDNIRMTVYFNPILPTRLISFDAILRNNETHLEWQTADEDDNESITLQRLAAGQSQWADLTTYEMHTETNGKKYSYEDILREKGNYSYRLAIKSPAQQVTYSTIKNIRYKGITTVSLFPNPSRDYIVIAGAGMISTITLTTAYGFSTKLPVKSIGNNKVHVNIQSVAPGIYFMNVGGEKTMLLKQ
jgi:hypothetical protein